MCEYDLVIPITSKCKDHSPSSPATITTLTATTTSSQTTTVFTTSTALGDDTTTTEKSISNKIVFSLVASICTIFFGLLL